MARLSMSRRAFLKVAAASSAAAALGAASPAVALAETAPSSSSADMRRVRSCCRGCGKMECGVWVTVQDGKVIRIEGDESAFQSHGNCCTKSQSSVQAAYHPDRLHYPLRRTQPKGEEPGWQRISWDEALGAMAQSYQQIIDQYGGESLFTMGGTSRAWAQACCYSSINALFQTPNSVQALQICKGPRFFANSLVNDMGLYWYEGTGQPRVYVQWGTAVEYSNYDNSCRTIVNRAKNADVHIVIDPRMTPMGKEADYWLNVRPGTDGAIGLCWTKLVWEKRVGKPAFHEAVDEQPIFGGRRAGALRWLRFGCQRRYASEHPSSERVGHC